MSTSEIKIQEYNDTFREQILTIWEASVLATHHFLLQADFNEIKEEVGKIKFDDFQVYCLTKDALVLGFIGVANQKIEMLFLAPDSLGQGFGTRLVNFVITELAANTVDVNEQNVQALRFYEKSGFEVFERQDKDDQGRAYPILRMKLRNE